MEISSQELDALTADFLSRGGQIDTPTAVWTPEGRGWMSGFSVEGPNKRLVRPAEPALSNRKSKRTAEEVAEQKQQADDRRALREEAYNVRVATLRRCAAEGKSRLEAMYTVGIKENKTLDILMKRHDIKFIDLRVAVAEAKRKAITSAITADREKGLQWPAIAKRNNISINTARRIAKEAGLSTSRIYPLTGFAPGAEQA